MTAKERHLIELAMQYLEEIPSGGIGEGGPTEKELEAAEKYGHSYDDDSNLHVVQRAWLILREVIGRAAKGEE